MPHQAVPFDKRSFARTLRRDMTEAEYKLWQELRGRRLGSIKFRRQVPVGQYVADFACLGARLIVEIDGSQHAGATRDETRTAELRSRGFRVLRFWNDEVLRELESVAIRSSRSRGISRCSRGGETSYPRQSQTYSTHDLLLLRILTFL